MPTPTTPIQPASDLPPPPNNWKEMVAHPLATQFRAAAQLEWDSVTKRGTYEKVNHLPSNTKVLPLRWVFAYKLDSSGKLERCKARIVA
jgi:hypothetical protein